MIYDKVRDVMLALLMGQDTVSAFRAATLLCEFLMEKKRFEEAAIILEGCYVFHKKLTEERLHQG
jgi:hypothetical protein